MLVFVSAAREALLADDVDEVLVHKRCTDGLQETHGHDARRSCLGNPLGSWLDVPPAGRDSSDSPLLGDQKRGGSTRLDVNSTDSLGRVFFSPVGGARFFQYSPLWVVLVLVLYTGLLRLALQFTASARSSLGLNKRPHRHEAGEYSLSPVFCPSPPGSFHTEQTQDTSCRCSHKRTPMHELVSQACETVLIKDLG